MRETWMMIDPLETVITFLKRDATLTGLVGDRLASKHQFGSRWTAGDRAMILDLDGGSPDLGVSHQRVRIAVRCYGKSQIEAMDVWRQLAVLCRAAMARVVVNTSQGKALLYFFLPETEPALLYDNEIKMDVVYVLFIADVSLSAI